MLIKFLFWGGVFVCFGGAEVPILFLWAWVAMASAGYRIERPPNPENR